MIDWWGYNFGGGGGGGMLILVELEVVDLSCEFRGVLWMVGLRGFIVMR